MPHVVTPETRARMRRIGQRDTAPELAVRRILKKLGIRYRTSVRSLPGTPDIVNQHARWAIFVHGCYWHGHVGCKLHTIPKTNTKFWKTKIKDNRRRDGRKARALRRLGLRVITVWQCETRSPARLERRLARLLKPEPPLEMGGDDTEFLRRKPAEALGPKSIINIVDLFSGCGGLTLGVVEAARQLGYAAHVSLALEKDPAIAGVYARNFRPECGEGGHDVRDWFDAGFGQPLSAAERITKDRVGPVDILVGGPPCQGHSSLNNHTRNDDPKNALYLCMVRAAEVLEPRALIIENVPAVERDAAGTLRTAIARLERLGYLIDEEMVSVSDIGVPQYRTRHVLLAHRHSMPSIELAINKAYVGRRSLRWAIHDLVDVESSSIIDKPARLDRANERRARFLLAKDLYDLPNSRRPKCQRNKHKYLSMYGRLRWNQPAQTITTGFGSPGQGRYLHPSRLRTLTPHEAARVQFFPDWFNLGSLKYKQDLARAIGNAVPPKLGFVLAHHLVSLDVTSAVARPASVKALAGLRRVVAR